MKVKMSTIDIGGHATKEEDLRIGAEKLAQLHEEQKALVAQRATNLVTIGSKR